jgi:hypothetical protein
VYKEFRQRYAPPLTPADNSRIRIPPSRDSQSVTPDTVNNHHTASQHISASQNDFPTMVHDTSRPDCILPENLNDASVAVVRSPSDREGIKETTHSNVRHFRSDVQRLTLIQSQSPIAIHTSTEGEKTVTGSARGKRLSDSSVSQFRSG